MALSRSRLLLVWTTLPIAVLLSYLWFKRKRTEVQSDPTHKSCEKEKFKNLQEELKEAESSNVEVPCLTRKPYARSLSGIDSAPIDIVFPPELRSSKSAQLIISDEDLDIEIEKIKSMKNSKDFFSSRSETDQKIVNAHSKSLTKVYQQQERQHDIEIPTLEVASPETPPPEVTPPKEASPKLTSSKVALQTVVPLKVDSPKATPPIVVPLNTSPKIASPKITTGSVKNHKSPIKKIETCILEENPTKTEMAQKDIVTISSIENKINSLKLDSKEQQTPKNNKGEPVPAAGTDHDIQRQSAERDSANHSPADVMLASPSLSCISDSHSEGSSDSGKGRSEVATPPTRTSACNGSVAGDVLALPTIYEFVIPQNLVGRLIGRQGSFVTQIKFKTQAHILIKKHPENSKLKVCSIEGAQSEIDRALEMIRTKFPLKRYPDVTLEQVAIAPLISTVPLMPEQLYLKLVEGVNNDTIVSCMVAPNHLFLQQPTHPSFPNLVMLSDCMNSCYVDDNSPMLPNPVPENSLCAAYSLGAWYRAIVLSTDKENESSYLKFLDYGGYANIRNVDLRQIRADFVLLPFQAAECLLYNIKPAGDEDAGWSKDAFNLVADLTKGSIVYTQIAEYTVDEIPLVLIYVLIGPQQILFLNEELVNRGFAEWLDCPQTIVNETNIAAAS